MKQITIRVDPDLLAAISERESVAIVAISERQSMAIVKQPRRTFAGERQAEAFIAAPRIACKLLKQWETKNRRREGTAPDNDRFGRQLTDDSARMAAFRL